MYIKLNSSSITLSPYPNQKIKGDKKDKSNLLFDKPIADLIESLNGFKEQWAIRYMNNIEIKRNAPGRILLQTFGANNERT